MYTTIIFRANFFFSYEMYVLVVKNILIYKIIHVEFLGFNFLFYNINDPNIIESNKTTKLQELLLLTYKRERDRKVEETLKEIVWFCV